MNPKAAEKVAGGILKKPKQVKKVLKVASKEVISEKIKEYLMAIQVVMALVDEMQLGSG